MKILIAADGSQDATSAASFFCRLPHDESLDIEIMTVVNTPDLSISASTEVWLPEYIERLEKTADDTYSSVAALFEGSDAKLHHYKTNGHIGNRIIQRADEVGAELIVIGAKGHSLIARMLLGSVSDFVSTHAHCSVLVVRPEEVDTKDHPGLRVTIAYDGSEKAVKTIDHFTQFAWNSGVDVQVVTVVQRIREFYQELHPIVQEQYAEERQAATRLAQTAVDRLAERGVRATISVVESDHVGEAVVGAANAFGSDLILIGNTGRSLLPRLLLGSVSAYVLRHAEKSVWVVR